MDPLRNALRRYLADEPYRRLTDDELWARFRDHREEGAFRVLLERTGGRIYARCRAVLRVEADAEEAFQEAFCALFKHRAKLPTYRAAVAWLYQTATNTARMQRRWQWRSLLRDRRKAAASPVSTEAGDFLAHQEQREAVAAALADLPERERRAVELVYLEGMTHAEAAEALGWRSPGTVSTYVQRGLERLRRAPGLREGTTGAVLTAAMADVPGLPPVRLAALSECIWTRAETAAVSAGGWSLTGRPRLVGGLTMVAGVALTVVAVNRPPAPPPRPLDDPPLTQSEGEVEPLRAKNERIMRDKLAPRIRDVVQEIVPGDNPVRLVAVRTRGSEVEVEFRADKRIFYEPRDGGYRFRYCVFRRQAFATTNLTPNGDWRPIPRGGTQLSATGLDLPYGLGHIEIDIGREQWDRIKAILNELPPDDRAERKHIEHLFGPPANELVLPVGHGLLFGNDRDLFCHARDDSVYVRGGASGWRYLGEYPNHCLAADESRLYRLLGQEISARPIGVATARWERVCDLPRKPSGDPVRKLEVSRGELMVATAEGLGASTFWFRPLTGSNPQWTSRLHYPLRTLYPAIGGKYMYLTGGPDATLLRIPLDWSAGWRSITRMAPGSYQVSVAQGQLLSWGHGDGPIYARPIDAGPEVGWRVFARRRTPRE